ncbi:MarR family transcriptional regulator [Exilibacterium tricleocarpae]|uniref:MarR family transcriptional regulator n=1 Tax=Exilibacterium tricleocarpae TaxID=2591008 RepID=A0A545SYW2_9GAMM|nr:MarR family transcriptional regulator [Exilibacterium tricleocarpae]TQV70153.1 MarR family transcriptional regulator [Exilibacterium tricleocarpae]
MSDQVIDELHLEHFLPYRLSILSNRVSNAIAADYGEQFEVTMPAWRVMAILGRYPGLVAAELAERTAMDKVAISRAVALLLEKGYITRDEHGSDRRRWILNLSAAGEAIYRRIVPLAKAYERDLIGGLSEAEVALLHDILDRMNARALDWLERGLDAEVSAGR